MNALKHIVLIFTAICISDLLFGQNSVSVDKDFDTTECVKLKDTTIYVIITQTKDTFYFGSDKRANINKSETKASNSFRPTSKKSLKILFNSNGVLLMTLDLKILNIQNDSIPAFNMCGEISRHLIYKFYNCNIHGLQIRNYEKIRQHAYYKELLTKIFEYKTQ